jgi:hypothetical protein
MGYPMATFMLLLLHASGAHALRTLGMMRVMAPARTRAPLASAKKAPASNNQKRLNAFQQKLATISNGVLLIDGDNLRGKTMFGLTHEAVLARTAQWAVRRGMVGRVVLLVDHGSLPSAFHAPRLGGIGVAFSGATASADDVAVSAFSWLRSQGYEVLLVTADSGLITRCRRSTVPAGHIRGSKSPAQQRSGASGRGLHVVPPQVLLSVLGVDVRRGRLGGSDALRAHGLPAVCERGYPDVERVVAVEVEMNARAALTRAERAIQRAGVR